LSNNLIICGNGHGIRAVYDGLISSAFSFFICTDDQDIIIQAKKDNIPFFANYLECISSTSDLVITSSYKAKIPHKDLNRAHFMNIHYALLPKYRGMHPIVWALLNGEDFVGFTIHRVSDLLDQGPIVYQEKVLTKNMTSWELMIEIDKLVTKKISSFLTDFYSGNLLEFEQSEKDAIFVAKRNLEDCRVLWHNWDARFFEKILRALVEPYPLPFFYFKDSKIEIFKAIVINKDYYEINGRIVYRDHNFVFIKIIGGLLKLGEIRINGVLIKAVDYFKKIGVRLN
jgi:methionyl-tRNA formyltransferase